MDIVKEKDARVIIGGDGNWHCNNDNYVCFLRDSNGDIASHQYQGMLYLGHDHYAVCKPMEDIWYFTDNDSVTDRYYSIVKNEYEIRNSKLKWGIMRLNRNDEGTVIPMKETMIIPYIYDKISHNNLKTATAQANGKLTYLDIDENSKYYAQQLVPCILSNAVPFELKYHQFAECSIGNTTGYLPRNCKVKEYLEGNELLTDYQTAGLSRYLTSNDDLFLDFETISAYFNLTGIKLTQEKNPTFTKKAK